MAQRSRADTLTGAITGLLKRQVRAPAATGRFAGGSFAALSDISFDIERGDVIGIVGRNGAGKSTLLKILANITAPTTGEVMIKGRVGCLLEVGTGFSPELSGRENIQLSAAILGMKNHEIKSRFDEIVDFADIPGFVDTPVKHYSSGMYMRLAFAVAAHLDHEILLVDEVLAVGDAAFQRKCQQKIGAEASTGRTILFVSHSLPAIAAMCNRALLLDEGRIELDDKTEVVLGEYQKSMKSGLAGLRTFDVSKIEHFGNGKARFSSLTLRAETDSGQSLDVMTTGADLIVEATVRTERPVEAANAAIVIYDSSGYRVIDANLLLAGQHLSLAAGDVRRVKFRLRDVRLRPGEYSVGLWLGRTNAEDIDSIAHAVTFIVEPDLNLVQHSATFPGIYQCRFDAEVILETEQENDASI